MKFADATLESVLARVAELRAIAMFTPGESQPGVLAWEVVIVLNGVQATGVSEHPIAAALGALSMLERSGAGAEPQ